jgi:hypothetical protein
MMGQAVKSERVLEAEGCERGGEAAIERNVSGYSKILAPPTIAGCPLPRAMMGFSKQIL